MWEAAETPASNKTITVHVEYIAVKLINDKRMKQFPYDFPLKMAWTGVKNFIGMGTSSGGTKKGEAVSPTLFRQPVGSFSGISETPGDSNELKRQRERSVSPNAGSETASPDERKSRKGCREGSSDGGDAGMVVRDAFLSPNERQSQPLTEPVLSKPRSTESRTHIITGHCVS